MLSSSCSSPCRVLLPSCTRIPTHAYNIWANFPVPDLGRWLPPRRSPPSENNGHLQARRCRRTSVEEYGVGGVKAMTGSPDVAHHDRMGEEVKEAQREPKSALSSAILQQHACTAGHTRACWGGLSCGQRLGVGGCCHRLPGIGAILHFSCSNVGTKGEGS